MRPMAPDMYRVTTETLKSKDSQQHCRAELASAIEFERFPRGERKRVREKEAAIPRDRERARRKREKRGCRCISADVACVLSGRQGGGGWRW